MDKSKMTSPNLARKKAVCNKMGYDFFYQDMNQGKIHVIMVRKLWALQEGDFLTSSAATRLLLR
jgi:hypothetical protein